MEVARIPAIYRIFFLYIEPISLLAGAIAAGRPEFYLSTLTLNSKPLLHPAPSDQVNISLYQLSNLYLLLAINEHFVLKSADSLKTWRTFIYGLLFADIGHFMTFIPLGAEAFYDIARWNPMMWGSLGFVYLCAALRTAFLLGVGFPPTSKKKA